MTDSGAVVLITCRVGGLVPPEGQAVLDITALASTPDHIRDALVADGIKRVQQEFPTAQDVKMIEDWGEFEFAPVDDD